MQHWGIRIDYQSKHTDFIKTLLGPSPPHGFKSLAHKKGAVFSDAEIARFLNKEERHDIKALTAGTSQSLKSMSSGERKKTLLNHLLAQQPDFLILVNPYDHLDVGFQEELKFKLRQLSQTISLVQLVSRSNDILFDITTDYALLENESIKFVSGKSEFLDDTARINNLFVERVPPPLQKKEMLSDPLVALKNVSVSFNGRQILKSVDWTIHTGDFWNLVGHNGSGKTTLLTMITGDSHKGYGQDLTLFGQKKGSGESVWDIKEHIGYFTPSMTDKFRGYHTLEDMLVSGLHDSVGLYVKPSDAQKRLAHEWLYLLRLESKKTCYFHELTIGEKRLLMTARAMIKHPPLLILDEPTAGLDDDSATFFVALINKYARESDSAVIFVSHRSEAGLQPKQILELLPTEEGSIGKITTLE